jgi:hypothetical protein
VVCFLRNVNSLFDELRSIGRRSYHFHGYSPEKDRDETENS